MLTKVFNINIKNHLVTALMETLRYDFYKGDILCL